MPPINVKKKKREREKSISIKDKSDVLLDKTIIRDEFFSSSQYF